MGLQAEAMTLSMKQKARERFSTTQTESKLTSSRVTRVTNWLGVRYLKGI